MNQSNKQIVRNLSNLADLNEVKELIERRIEEKDFCEDCDEILIEEDWIPEMGGTAEEIVYTKYKCGACGFEGGI